MNDKELLMMAAKAAGVVGEYVENYSPGDYYADQFYCGNECGILTGSLCCYDVWNPLTDDGDALRLAVKLRMDINISHRTNEVIAYTMTDKIGRADEKWNVDIDEYAATRRAIVRAAAEIGRRL